ncbi:MAG: DUF4258 domain-containing protein [Bacteroidetes bacterium]|nr:DUF4258 domain-containing protein [Bacteroidota bacterium]
MNFKYSKHAIEQIDHRNLDIKLIDEILENPDRIIVDATGLSIYQKLDIINQKPYLYRIFVNTKKNPPLIVTVYRTSKLEKYED